MLATELDCIEQYLIDPYEDQPSEGKVVSATGRPASVDLFEPRRFSRLFLPVVLNHARNVSVGVIHTKPDAVATHYQEPPTAGYDSEHRSPAASIGGKCALAACGDPHRCNGSSTVHAQHTVANGVVHDASAEPSARAAPPNVPQQHAQAAFPSGTANGHTRSPSSALPPTSMNTLSDSAEPQSRNQQQHQQQQQEQSPTPSAGEPGINRPSSSPTRPLYNPIIPIPSGPSQTAAAAAAATGTTITTAAAAAAAAPSATIDDLRSTSNIGGIMTTMEVIIPGSHHRAKYGPSNKFGMSRAPLLSLAALAPKPQTQAHAIAAAQAAAAKPRADPMYADSRPSETPLTAELIFKLNSARPKGAPMRNVINTMYNFTMKLQLKLKQEERTNFPGVIVKFTATRKESELRLPGGKEGSSQGGGNMDPDAEEEEALAALLAAADEEDGLADVSAEGRKVKASGSAAGAGGRGGGQGGGGGGQPLTAAAGGLDDQQAETVANAAGGDGGDGDVDELVVICWGEGAGNTRKDAKRTAAADFTERLLKQYPGIDVEVFGKVVAKTSASPLGAPGDMAGDGIGDTGATGAEQLVPPITPAARGQQLARLLSPDAAPLAAKLAAAAARAVGAAAASVGLGSGPGCVSNSPPDSSNTAAGGVIGEAVGNGTVGAVNGGGGGNSMAGRTGDGAAGGDAGNHRDGGCDSYDDGFGGRKIASTGAELLVSLGVKKGSSVLTPHQLSRAEAVLSGDEMQEYREGYTVDRYPLVKEHFRVLDGRNASAPKKTAVGVLNQWVNQGGMGMRVERRDEDPYDDAGKGVGAGRVVECGYIS